MCRSFGITGRTRFLKAYDTTEEVPVLVSPWSLTRRPPIDWGEIWDQIKWALDMGHVLPTDSDRENLPRTYVPGLLQPQTGASSVRSRSSLSSPSTIRCNEATPPTYNGLLVRRTRQRPLRHKDFNLIGRVFERAPESTVSSEICARQTLLT